MALWSDSKLERIALALERLVALQEHKMGVKPIVQVVDRDESSISYFDREKEFMQEMRRRAFVEEVGMEPPSEEAMYPGGIVPGEARE